MSTNSYICLSVVLTRLIPFAVCIPAIIHGNMIVYSSTALRCMLAPQISGLQNILILIVNISLPCSIVIYCFIRIYKHIRFARQALQNRNAIISVLTYDTSVTTSNSLGMSMHKSLTNLVSGKNWRAMRKEIEVSKMFGVIFLVFLFGFLPYGEFCTLLIVLTK